MGGTGKAEAAKLPAAGNGSTGCGKSQFKPAFGSTGFLACAGFAALIIDAQPRVAVLLDFFRSLFSPRSGVQFRLREQFSARLYAGQFFNLPLRFLLDGFNPVTPADLPRL